jgi:LuxR family maltose regulon positive regulatory protein
LLIKALTLREKGDSKHAIQALTECLTLAEPEGYVRVFLDEGKPMQLLLAQWLAHEQAHGPADASSGRLVDYAIHLLTLFKAEPQQITAQREKTFPAGELPANLGQSLVEHQIRPDTPILIEHLSLRELEVLQLIALGRTNLEIARQLIVAPGTIKAHTASIYRKLGVSNRTEAAARARQLGMLP